MAKKNRLRRSRDDLMRELREQLKLLQFACEKYDAGFEASGKHIALSLRVLVHNHGQSRSLLEQLGMLLNVNFYDTCGPVNPENILSGCNLLMTEVVLGSGARYRPRLADGPPEQPTRVKLTTWWNEPVLKDNEGRLFNRRQLILNVADTDGGAHVDPELDEAYMELSRNNSLGWVVGDESGVEAPEGRPELACMRQVAHELLMTLKDVYPDLFD